MRYNRKVSALNPFVWDRPIDDTSKIVGMDAFASEMALVLKARTNVILFGPRDTGKTTFTTQLMHELARSHGADAPPHEVVRINLQRAMSIPAFCACVHDALTAHPAKALRREARRQLQVMEREIGFDIRVVKGSVKRAGVTPEQDAEALHAQLASLARLSEHLVVVFDEFQMLRHCPNRPLSIIRSALMSSGANHVTLLMTGSIRNALRMMVENSEEPLFGEAHQAELPQIAAADFLEFLDFQLQATQRPAQEEALLHLLNLTRSHPKRTQQLAWATWRAAASDRLPIGSELVQQAYDELILSTDTQEFQTIVQGLTSGDDTAANDLRALSVLADQGGAHLTSRTNATLYGFSSHTRLPDACERLHRRGLVQKVNGAWQLVDPFFEEWLRVTSPFAGPTGVEW
jgi:D-serine deaminase-like pyridoxal phosphate-dependent protein